MPNLQEWQFLMEQNWAQQGLHPWPLSHQEAPFSILPLPPIHSKETFDIPATRKLLDADRVCVRSGWDGQPVEDGAEGVHPQSQELSASRRMERWGLKKFCWPTAT